MKFNIGDKVRPNLDHWIPGEFDPIILPYQVPTGRVVGVEAFIVQVRWPNGKAWSYENELEVVNDDE